MKQGEGYPVIFGKPELLGISVVVLNAHVNPVGGAWIKGKWFTPQILVKRKPRIGNHPISGKHALAVIVIHFSLIGVIHFS